MSSSLPIAALIEERRRELGLNLAQVATRAGYRNSAKGIRRLQELYRGEEIKTNSLVAGLPAALELSLDAIQRAIDESHIKLRQAADARFRAAFAPHAIVVTERDVPQPMYLAGVIGVNRLLRIELDVKAGPISYAQQAVSGLRQKQEQFGESLPAFGRPIGLIINYSPDIAVEFDAVGNPKAVLREAYQLGQLSLRLGGRCISSNELSRIVMSGSAD